MTRKQAEARIRKAAPWASLVTVSRAPDDPTNEWLLDAIGSGVQLMVWGRTLKAAVSRLEGVLKGGSK